MASTNGTTLGGRTDTVPVISAKDLQEPTLGKLNRTLQLISGQIAGAQQNITQITNQLGGITNNITEITQAGSDFTDFEVAHPPA